jgi:hypothetical protein
MSSCCLTNNAVIFQLIEKINCLAEHEDVGIGKILDR